MIRVHLRWLVAVGAASVLSCTGTVGDNSHASANGPNGGTNGNPGNADGPPPHFDISPLTAQADIHRLNRVEYANTIRDLTSIEFDPVALLVDSTSLGFDNISSVQTTTPGHVEAYLAAAERIADAIVDQSPANVAIHYELASNDVGKFPGQDHRDLIKDVGGGYWQLGGSDEVRVTLRLPRDGAYKITVHARPAPERDPNAPKGFAFADVSVDAKLAGSVVIDKGEGDYVVQAQLTRGLHSLAIGAHIGNCSTGLYNCGPLVHVKAFGVENATAAPESGSTSPYGRVFTCKPTPGQEATCAADILKPFATRAWRRPVEADLLTRLVSVATAATAAGAGFDEAIGAALREVLSSPRFLYRFESAADAVKGYRALDDYELAARLSYFLWSTMPDAELTSLADQATLTKPETLETQVTRMLAHPKAQALTDNFAGQWLFLRAIPGVTKNPTWHPDFDASLDADLVQESRRLFSFVAHGDGSALDLVTGDYAFLNDRLRTYYGLPTTGKTEFERTSLAATGRRGLLGEAGLLSYLARPERSSPVTRGKWVLTQLLCTTPAPPPKGIPPLPALKDTESMTMRDVMVQHRASPTCAACHQIMDPMGFALENFDGAGKWIDDYRGQPLDLTGQMPTTGAPFNGPKELASAIAADARFPRCVASKLFTYATARAPDAFDDAQIDVLAKSFAESQFSFPALVAKLATSPAFTLRRAADPAAAAP